jgi:hypothetical protein
MKTYGVVEVELQSFLTSALDGDEWSVSRPDRFTPGEKAPDTHWLGGWVETRAGLDAEDKKNLSAPAGIRTPVVQPVVRIYTDWAFLTLCVMWVDGLWTQSLHSPPSSHASDWPIPLHPFIHLVHQFISCPFISHLLTRPCLLTPAMRFVRRNGLTRQGTMSCACKRLCPYSTFWLV